MTSLSRVRDALVFVYLFLSVYAIDLVVKMLTEKFELEQLLFSFIQRLPMGALLSFPR